MDITVEFREDPNSHYIVTDNETGVVAYGETEMEAVFRCGKMAGISERSASIMNSLSPDVYLLVRQDLRRKPYIAPAVVSPNG